MEIQMSIVNDGNWQRCSTCEFWTGKRRTRTSDNTEVEIEEDQDKRGSCIGPTWKGSTYEYDHACSDWRKWGVLR